MKKSGKLILGIKKGDKKAEKIFYDRYKEYIEKYLQSKYPKEANLEDCVSEIIIKLFQNIDQFDKKRGKFNTWVIKIANNYMIDRARKNENNPIQASLDSIDGSLSFYCNTTDLGGDLTVNTTSNFSTPTSFTSQPDQEMETNDSLDFISNKIGIKDFHLLNMKYGEGYDYKDMEKEMKMSSNTISNRVNYVRSKLKGKKGK